MTDANLVARRGLPLVQRHVTIVEDDGALVGWPGSWAALGSRLVVRARAEASLGRAHDHRALPICPRAEECMAPSPREVVLAFRDLGLTDREIGRYFGIPAECIRPLAKD